MNDFWGVLFFQATVLCRTVPDIFRLKTTLERLQRVVEASYVLHCTYFTALHSSCTSLDLLCPHADAG